MSASPVILLVEDEPMLRRVVAMTLKGDGFTVFEAGDGIDALAILRSDQRLDLLLTDVRMPGMNGYQLAGEALALRPGLPVILMTGFSDDEMPAAIREAAIPTLRKPFDFATLGSSLRKLVAR
jgi:DNA-binding NtrC family response regulator